MTRFERYVDVSGDKITSTSRKRNDIYAGLKMLTSRYSDKLPHNIKNIANLAISQYDDCLTFHDEKQKCG
jgi:hypothetical protein